MYSAIHQRLDEAESLHRSGDLSAARGLYFKLTEERPALADGWFGLGTIALQQQDPTAARIHLQRALSLAPERPEIRLFLSMALQRLELRSEALQQYAATARAATGDPPLQLQALRGLLQLDAPQEALEILADQPRPTLEQALLGVRARAELGDRTGATKDLERMMSVAPKHAEAQRELAAAAEGLEDHPLALQAFERYLALIRPRPEDHLRHGDLLLMTHRPEAAAVAVERARAAGGGGSELALLSSRARAGCGDWAGAVRDLQEVVTAAPDDSEAQRELATAAARLRDYPMAVRAFERYLTLIHPGPEEHIRHGDLLLMAHRPAAAIATVEQARAAGGKGPKLALLEARCARLTGRYDACREAAEAVLAARPTDGDAWQLRLENADEVELPALLERCEHLLRSGDDETNPADDSAAGTRHHMLIALAAGRARERLGEPEAAFELCRRGKEIQRHQLRSRGTSYDPGRQAESFHRIIGSFSGRAATAPPAGVERSPMFIVGMPRSGTTLVERILGSFEGVETAGENEALEFIAHGYQHGRDQGRMPAPGEMTPEYWQRLADEYWHRTGGEPRRITDKMPHNFRHLGLIDALFPDAPVLWMRRDPRDVCLSIYVQPLPDGHSYACDLAALGHFYAQSERLLRHWQVAWPGRILEVDYEALVADPETGTRRIAEHCGLEWTPECLRFHERTEASFTFSELQVRRPINADGIGRWRRHAEALAPLIEALEAGGVDLPHPT